LSGFQWSILGSKNNPHKNEMLVFTGLTTRLPKSGRTFV
jgi:hypothetical protein